MATTIGYALMISGVVWSLWTLVVYSGRMGTRRLTGLNDSDTSKRYFLLLLGQARHKMITYDDGNDVEDSVYKDQEVLKAIEEKLREHPEFTMQCLFNCPVPDSLRTKFAEEHRMAFRSTGLGKEAPRDTHMKIIDDGRMAYFTRHDYGSVVRPYELVDCLTVAPWALKSVARGEIGDCMELFDKRFQQASAE